MTFDRSRDAGSEVLRRPGSFARITPLLLCLTAAAAAADAPDVKQTCRADVTAMTTALSRGDFARVADLSHPKLVAAAGGREKLIATLADAAKQMRAKGIAIRSAAVDAPADPVANGDFLYVVVPYTLSMTAPEGKLKQKSFVVGVSGDGGRTWRYVNGDMDPRFVKSVLPDLPDTLKLPKREQPTVDKP